MPRSTLGVALITHDAAARLAECLASIAFADAIIVLDSGSSDATCDIARAYRAEVHVDSQWPGFGAQKNRALALLDTDWILSLDADEIVTPELAASIQAAIASNDGPPVYAVDRLSSFCGHWMRHSGWYPDWTPRLFKRGAARFSDDLVHERLLYDGPAARLAGRLLHYSYEDFETVLRKLNAYSTASAQQRFAAGQTGSLCKALRRSAWAFARTYLMQWGFLDGKAGLMVAIFNAQTVYYRFVKLERLCKSKSQKE